MGKMKKNVESKLKRKERYKKLYRKMVEGKTKKKTASINDDSHVEQGQPSESLLDLDEHTSQSGRTATHVKIKSTIDDLTVEQRPSAQSLLGLDINPYLKSADTCFTSIQTKRNNKRKTSNDTGSLRRKIQKNTPIKLANETFMNDDDAKEDGHRIIQLDYFIKQLCKISCHNSLFECSLSTMKLIKEKKHGLSSTFLFKCLMCQEEFEVSNSKENLNHSVVEGAMAAGCGYAQLNQITAALDLPVLSQYTYGISHEEVCQHWEATAWEEMKKAGDEERQAAVKEGKISKDGIGLIDVIVDGCWCKRSYKTNYAALSGAAAIIGKRFGKVLFISVKNKYCCICARAEKRRETVKNHICFKNYCGPSTGMEADIISEGFKQSIEMHQLIYSRFIADGDSSTYSKILETRPYKDITVEKISCKNHILRNFCNKLQQLKVDTRYNIKERKQITTEKILKARKYICNSIKYHNENKGHDSIQKLHNDVNMCMKHAFDSHDECNENICQRAKIQGSSCSIFHGQLWQKVCFLTANVASNARSLIENVDSNVVERFNGVIAKFVGGKRINYATRRSYQARCAGAVVSFNSKKIHTTVSKNIYMKSPSLRMKKFEDKIEHKRQYNQKIKRKKNRLLVQKKIDFNYGENADTPDMDPDIYEMTKTTFLKNLEKTEKERQDIQERTILQSECGEWMELRRNLLTASNFGKVVKRKKNNNCANMVKNMLYRPEISHVASISHGKKYEKIALEQLSISLNIKIKHCGLFIDEKYPFLGATPDGIIDDTVVEVKCPIAPYRIGIEEAIKQGKMHFWRFNKKTEEVTVNIHSDWFIQAQGQMHVSNKSKCILAVWYGDHKIKTELIEKDDEFWKERMEAKLLSFYFDCLLPELIDPRFTKNKPIRTPTYTNKENSIKNKENENLPQIVNHARTAIVFTSQNSVMEKLQSTINFSDF